MIIYLESKLKRNKIANNIISKFPLAEVLEIDNYKNIFDKNLNGNVEKSIAIASVNNAVLKAPIGYGHPGKGFFLKNSLNCVYDCKYCYLKGAFKNSNILVIFLNYDDMKAQILDTISKKKDDEAYRFYTSDYGDNLAIDHLTSFVSEFVPFFDSLNNVKAEIRTKSVNISSLLKMKPSKNIEIAFSLNPEEIVQKYELKTPSLGARIKAINSLINSGWQVGIRFLPLLQVKDYESVYTRFLEYITSKIDFSKVYSVFVGGLLYTKRDYNSMLKKEPYLDLLYKLKDSGDGFIREKRHVRDFFYNLFDRYLPNQRCSRCLDE